MNKERIREIFQNTFISTEKFKQQRIKLAIEELKKHMEMDEAMECICELFKAYKQSQHMENAMKNGIPKIEKEQKSDDNKVQ